MSARADRSNRGPVPDPATVDWEALANRLYAAGYRVPIKQHNRTPEQQAAVENFTQAMVEASDVLHGPETGLMGAPLESSPFVDRRKWRPTVEERMRLVDALDRLITVLALPTTPAARVDALAFGREVWDALAKRYYGDAERGPTPRAAPTEDDTA